MNGNWDDLMHQLALDIQWDHPVAEEAAKMEKALQRLTSDPALLLGRLEQLRASDEGCDYPIAYKEQFNYPAKIMDIMPLYIDPEGRFAVRLHRIKGRRQGAPKQTKLHSHDWMFATYMLSGAYLEPYYKIVSTDETEQTAQLAYLQDRVLEQGQSQSMLLDYAHETVNEQEEDAYTLVLIGQSSGRGFMNYDLATGTYSVKRLTHSETPAREQWLDCVRMFQDQLLQLAPEDHVDIGMQAEE
ncbi:hypothetical protein PA598K_03422 [Paenibacillus sp. 598K]|uniref:hypothetical protein n=1 Tax=Paenibacillus sp. 598K TaxID=1117987 RepID=UPI000FF9107B|nr:hypothetical protein [Paenibacillus sp. 598K]GBF75043.1 hypothetical protein PA598K_03422 [Paenibacillus sp. 598K]